MAKIKLMDGFTPIPEGQHIFAVTGVEYKEDFGKLVVNMETSEGKKHQEKYSLLRQDGSPNDGAMAAFSYFAKAALNDFEVEEIDPDDLVGCKFIATAEHDVRESNKTPGKTVTFVHVKDIKPYTEEEAEATAPSLADLLD